MEMHREKEAIKEQYEYWVKMDYIFRLESYEHMKEMEKDKKVKSVMFRGLEMAVKS
jgi:hypothetical protein